jgi:hypothetical protein
MTAFDGVTTKPATELLAAAHAWYIRGTRGNMANRIAIRWE